jgi:putative transposase
VSTTPQQIRPSQCLPRRQTAQSNQAYVPSTPVEDEPLRMPELREQNGRLKRLLAEAELEKDALREVAKGKF